MDGKTLKEYREDVVQQRVEFNEAVTSLKNKLINDPDNTNTEVLKYNVVRAKLGSDRNLYLSVLVNELFKELSSDTVYSETIKGDDVEDEVEYISSVLKKLLNNNLKG